MSIQKNRKLATLKMEIPLFNKVEKKRKKEKVFKTFHELGIHLVTQYSK